MLHTQVLLQYCYAHIIVTVLLHTQVLLQYCYTIIVHIHTLLLHRHFCYTASIVKQKVSHFHSRVLHVFMIRLLQHCYTL